MRRLLMETAMGLSVSYQYFKFHISGKKNARADFVLILKKKLDPFTGFRYITGFAEPECRTDTHRSW